MTKTDTYIVTTYNSITKEKLIQLRNKGLRIYFSDKPEVYIDEVGGIHNGKAGISPYGSLCMDCEYDSCEKCLI